jgi:hypothetical protein
VSLGLDKYNALRTINTVLHSSLNLSIKTLFITEIIQKFSIPKDTGMDDALRIMRAFGNNKRIVDMQLRKIEENLCQWITQNNITSPLPGQDAFTGDYVVGKTMGNGIDATIDFSLENNLAIIFSKSGGGKTNLMYNIVPQALNKITKSGMPLRVHVYEMAKREAIYLLSRYPDFLVLNPYTAFNPLFPPFKTDLMHWNSIFWELTCQELGIRYETMILLEEACARLFEEKAVSANNIQNTCPTLPEFTDALYDRFISPQTREDRNMRSAIATALKHLRPLCRRFKSTLNVRCGILQGQDNRFSDHNIIYEMGWPGLTTKEKRWLTKIRVRYSRMEKELCGEVKDIELLTVFEEAKYIWGIDRSGKSTIDFMKQEIDESRAIGIAFLGMSQRIEDFTDFIRNSAAYYICLPLGKQGIQSAARAMECSEFDIRRLHIPYGIMNMPTHPGGFKIRIEKAQIVQEKKELLQQEAHKKLALFQENTAMVEPKDVRAGQKMQDEQPKPVEINIKGKALKDLAGFLRYICDHPDHKSLSELYDNYGIGREKGTRLKNDLIENKLAEPVKIMEGTRKRPSIRLRVTESGHQWLSRILSGNKSLVPVRRNFSREVNNDKR